MATNLVRKNLNVNQTFVVPAGVKTARLTLIDKYRPSFVAGTQFSHFSTISNFLFGGGVNTFYQLGVESNLCGAYSSPVMIKRLQFVEPSTMRAQGISMMIDSRGVLYGWGLNTGGILGQDPAFTAQIPMPVPLFSEYEWRLNAMNSANAYGVTIDGQLLAWGSNLNGELGDGTFNVPKSSPVAVIGATNVKYVDANGTYMAYIDALGNMFTVGSNGQGTLGDGTTVGKSSPVAIAGGGVWQDVAVGFDHMLALDNSGNVWAWGGNAQGQLGDGTVVSKSSPVMIISSATLSVARVYASGNLFGAKYSAVLTTDGKMYTFGGNNFGVLGLGDVVARSTPTLIVSTQVFTGMSLGGTHILASDAGGTLYGWGGNDSGQLLDGTVVPKSSPVAIVTPQPVYPRPNQVVERRSISLTPGASLPVVLTGRYVAFGREILGSASNAQLILEYHQ